MIFFDCLYNSLNTLHISQDCTSTEVQRFSCISGSFGGRPEVAFEFGCQAVWPDSKDWTPILCVVTNNSPFLGYFFKYTSPALAASANDYSSIIAGKSSYSYQETESRNSFQNTNIGNGIVYPFITAWFFVYKIVGMFCTTFNVLYQLKV